MTRRVSLVPFSGGVDSTYVLAKLLRETDDEVIALYIRMGNRERRWKAEDRATSQIADYCRTRFRDFRFIQTTVDRRRLQSFGLDVITVSFQVGLVHRHWMKTHRKPVDRFLFGYCQEEYEEDQAREDRENRLTRLRTVRHIASDDAHFPAFDTLEIVSKAAEISYLGPQLSGLCWSCRAPIISTDGDMRVCGTCKTCQLIAKSAAS